jgi:DNA-binding transcriptional MocR family regulator
VSETDTLYSISQLAKVTGLDRATVTKRLGDIEVTGGAKGAKTYSLADALPALIAGESTEMDEAKLRKVQAEAELKELEVEQERGELLPVKEVRDYLQDLFKRLQQRTVVQMPVAIASQLYKAESPAQISDTLQRELGRIFNDLRADHKSFR